MADEPDNSPLIIEAQWTGPLPPPEILARFEEVIPGAAERMLRMAEIEQQHRLTQDSASLTANIKSAACGQLLGALIAFTALIGAVVNTYLRGHWSVSVALVGVPVASIVNALIRGRK